MIAHALRSCSSSALLLDRTELLDGTARRHEVEPAVAQHLVEPVRKHALERDAPGEHVGELRDQVPLRQHGLDALDRLRGLEVAEVGEEARAVLLDEERAVRALEAAEVADVRRVGDEQRLLEVLAEAVDAVGHEFSFRYWSA